MMKKDLLNKQVVRAISLGLSAVMLTTPMTALASEATDVEPVDADKNTIEQNDVDEQTEAYADASDAVDTARVEIKEAEKAVADKTLDDDVDDTVLTNEKKTAEEVEITYDDAKADAIAEQLADASEDMATAADALSVAEATEERANEIVDTTITPTLDAVNDNNDVIVEENAKASAATQKATEAIDKANDANTEAEANAAIDEANELLEDAKEAQAAAQALVDENKKALEDIADDVEEAKAKLEAAQAAVGTTEAELEEAVKNLVNAEEAAEALEAELAASEEALKNSKEAALQAAYDAMKAEAKKVGPDGLHPYNGKAGEEDYINKFGSESAGGSYWTISLEYFKLYIEYMYDGKEDVSYKWAKEGSAAAVESNTYTVTYKDENDNPVTKYYNYHLADKTGEITIYEKVWGEREVTKQKEVEDTEDLLGTQNEDGTWTQYEEAEGELAVDNGDNKYVAKGEAVVETTTLAENQEVVGETETTTYVDENGKIVVVTTAEVETVVASHNDRKVGRFTKSDFGTVSAHENARRAAEARKKELEAQGYKNVEYTINDREYDFPWWYCSYNISYDEVEKESQVLETKTYDATKYEMHTFVTGSHMEPYQDTERCWTERKDLANDAAIEAAMEKIQKLTETIAAKKEAAIAAEDAVEEARKAAEAAKDTLEAVKADLDSTAKEVEAAEVAYKEAEAELKAAEEDLEGINDAVAEAEDAYDEAVEELDRFIPTPSTGDADDDDDDTTGGTTPVAPVVPVVPGTEIAEGGAVVTPVATGTGAGAGAAVVDIEDEETPLAAGIDNENGNGDANGGDGEEVLVAGAEEDENAIVAIEDEETPLAAGSGADGKMSWWWLLIVALLGATGYKMYKEHQKKKEEAAQEA